MNMSPGSRNKPNQTAVRYWLRLISQSDFEVSKQRGFDLIGLPEWIKNADDYPSLNDRVLFYVLGLRVFAATCTIISDWFDSSHALWESEKNGQEKPRHAKIKSDCAPSKGVEALDIAPSLVHVKDWPPDMWEYAFIEGGYFQPIPQGDFECLERELKRKK